MDITVLPSFVDLAIGIPSPSFLIGKDVPVSPVSLSISIPAPVINFDMTVFPTPVTLTISIPIIITWENPNTYIEVTSINPDHLDVFVDGNLVWRWAN